MYYDDFKRGQIYYITKNGDNIGSEQADGRPAIIVSNEVINTTSAVLECVYLTTQPKKEMPTHVEIRSARLPSTALCEQIVSISKERFGDYVGECTAQEMKQIDIALMISLGIDTVEPITQPEEECNSFYDETIHHMLRVEGEMTAYKEMYESLLSKIMG